MKRPLLLALLLAVTVVGAALLLRPRRSYEVPEPERRAASRSGADTPAPAQPIRTPTAPPPDRAEPRTAAPSPPAPPDRAEPRTAAPSPAVPADGAALREEADRLIAEGKVMEGIKVFRKAVAADPTPKNHGDLGGLLYRLTAFDEAAIHLRAAAELDPGNADRWIALANVYYRKVDPGEAWKAERRARQAEPGLELGRDNEGMRVRRGETAPRDP